MRFILPRKLLWFHTNLMTIIPCLCPRSFHFEKTFLILKSLKTRKSRMVLEIEARSEEKKSSNLFSFFIFAIKKSSGNVCWCQKSQRIIKRKFILNENEKKAARNENAKKYYVSDKHKSFQPLTPESARRKRGMKAIFYEKIPAAFA